MQLFYNLSDPAMEDALYDSVAVQRFVGLTARDPRRMRRAPAGTAPAGRGAAAAPSNWRRRVGCGNTHAPILDAPASKEPAQARDPEMHQVKKGNQWYFGMKAHIRRGHGTRARLATAAGGYHASARPTGWLRPGQRRRSPGSAAAQAEQRKA